MEKRRFMKDNKGYSLVEMIIVLAIVLILTGAAMATITIMHSAKAKEAAITLDSELSSIQQYSKGRMCVVGGTQQPDYKYALVVYKDGSKYYVKKGYYIGNGSPKDDKDSYVYNASENANSGKGECFSSYVTVKFKYKNTISDTIEEREIGTLETDPVYIIYDRQGMCVYGDGEYMFYRNGKEVYLNSVTLNKNGSHTTK